MPESRGRFTRERTTRGAERQRTLKVENGDRMLLAGRWLVDEPEGLATGHFGDCRFVAGFVALIVVSQMFASWNRIRESLRCLDELRRAGLIQHKVGSTLTEW
jgi:hypothetical protein